MRAYNPSITHKQDRHDTNNNDYTPNTDSSDGWTEFMFEPVSGRLVPIQGHARELCFDDIEAALDALETW